MEEHPERYYEELVPGKEYTTKLPRAQGIHREETDLDNTAMFNATCGGLSQSDLQTLEVNRITHQTHDQRIGVWTSDDISPASFMLNYKSANAIFNWTPSASTRLFAGASEAGVVIHSDLTFVHVREGGRYVSHYSANSDQDEARLRSFTSETIPFSVHSHQSPGELVMMQEILLDAYNLMENFIFFTDGRAQSLQDGVARTKFDV